MAFDNLLPPSQTVEDVNNLIDKYKLLFNKLMQTYESSGDRMIIKNMVDYDMKELYQILEETDLCGL